MTKIAVIKEKKLYENRVALTPDIAYKLMQMGFDVCVEKDAGLNANFPDFLYEEKGIKVLATQKAALENADIILKVAPPEKDDLKNFPEKSILIGILSPHSNKDLLKDYSKKKISACSLDLLPRITRAQSMDVLSSQSNLAGYKAVLEVTQHFARAFPMMMTAAGTIPPAKVLIIGAGVAGLQAIATAKRLGAVVFSFDVRTVAKEQVESLGATFVEVKSDESGDTNSGYAKEMSEDYKKKQSELIAETLKKMDVVITTALIPGKPAPRLITSEMISHMKPGSVLLDLAVESGGNIEGSKLGEVVETHNVKIVGKPNLPSSVAQDASMLYSKNIFTFISTFFDKDTKQFKINQEDEIIQGVLLTHDGEIVHPLFKGE